MDPITYAYAATITKSERDENGDLIVYGKATGPDLDLDDQICDPTWLKSAMPAWFEWGNMREMHQPIAAGIGIELSEIGDDWYIKSKVIDPGTAAKIEAGVLKGHSIGIKGAKVVKDAGAPGGRIVGGVIVENSYVDRPCNPTAKMAICKMVGDEWQPVEAPVDEPAEDTAKGVDPTHLKWAAESAEQVKALVPDLAKASPEQDVADARTAIAAVARLIMSEAEDLAAGRMGEAYQISILLDAVCALRWFIDCESNEEDATGGDVMLDATPDLTKTAGATAPESTTSTADLEDLVKTAVAEANKTHEAALDALRAELVKVRSQPVPGGPVLARPVQDIAKAGHREQLLAEAERYERTALGLRPSDPIAASGYAQKAAGLRANAAAL